MGKGYNDKGNSSAENLDVPLSKEYPSNPTDKTLKAGESAKSGKKKGGEENCVTWSKNILKTARISKITQEYRENKEYKPSVSISVSEKMMDKNRYRHIFCADENRVVLKERETSTDYIHASWMEMPDQVQFISTQGPIKNTIADFWHMIYTEKCPVVVMLCQYVEDDQEKCQKYFSESSTSEKEFGDYKVKVVEKTTEVFSPVKYTVIQVQKKNSSTKHSVHHYWYHDWHDQVAPLDPSPMVKLYKTVLKKASGKPIVVHCSAGVGRTSTFVGIHLGSCMIRENPSVEMVEILKQLRKMRLGSIQSQLQYVFLIVCIIQLFIEEKCIKRDSLFESLLKKYSDVTKKVTAAIVEEEAHKKRKKMEKEETERNEKKEAEKKEAEAKEKKELEKKDKMQSEKKRKEKRDSDVPTRGSRKNDEKESKNQKKADEKEAEAKCPKAKDRKDPRREEEQTVPDKTLDVRKSDPARKDMATSPSVYHKIGANDKSKYKADTKNGKKAVPKKSKRKANIFGI